MNRPATNPFADEIPSTELRTTHVTPPAAAQANTLLDSGAYRLVTGAEIDWEAYRDIRLLALRIDPQSFGATYEEEIIFTDDDWRAGAQRLREDATAALHAVADASGHYVAMCRTTRGTGKRSHIVTFTSVFTHPDARGRWLARTCFQSAIGHWTAVWGVRKFSLSVVSANTAAVGLYSSIGFEVTGTMHGELHYEWAYHDEYHMELAVGSEA